LRRCFFAPRGGGGDRAVVMMNVQERLFEKAGLEASHRSRLGTQDFVHDGVKVRGDDVCAFGIGLKF